MKRKEFQSLIRAWLVLILLLIAGCVGTNSVTPKTVSPVPPTIPINPTQTSSVPDLPSDALKNADYSIPALAEFLPLKARNKPIKLSDGQYHYIYEAGAATELVIKFQQYTVGDLDSDGQNDAAVVLFVSPGGSGTFYYLVAVLNQSGQPEVAAATSLGDRIVIEKLAVQDGVIIVHLVTQGPEDPMCCPAMKVEQHYRLQNGSLVQTSSSYP